MSEIKPVITDMLRTGNVRDSGNVEVAIFSASVAGIALLRAGLIRSPDGEFWMRDPAKTKNSGKIGAVVEDDDLRDAIVNLAVEHLATIEGAPPQLRGLSDQRDP